MVRPSALAPFTLRCGDTDLVVDVVGDAYPGASDRLKRRFAAFLDDAAPRAARKLHCTLRFVDDEWLPIEPLDTPSPVARRRGAGWDVAWRYYRGAFDPERAAIDLIRRPPCLEHALRAAAVFGRFPEQLFFHAATLVYAGRAWMFAGHSDAGKSTLSVEGGASGVLTNELSILARRDDGWWALPSPFWGIDDVGTWHPPVPLAGAVVLTQARDANAWTRLDGARAVAALMPHAGAQAAAQLAEPGALAQVARLTREVPVGALAWHRASHPFEGAPWKP